jgi:5-formyltetrahydrofolate cyclo-ligase
MHMADPDVARWRKAERERLIAMRLALAAEQRALHTKRIVAELDELLARAPATVVSVYWPIRAEPDLRDWMRELCQRGVRIALPVALALGEPMIFREWRPGVPMARGLWNIPHPADGVVVEPDCVLAPLVGFDADGYRLGYGGGFFDRTLATMSRKPHVVGVGYPETRIPTIFPQPHDVPMDSIVTGAAN